jgi:Zn-dependent peptidase ImmA (M78 family)
LVEQDRESGVTKNLITATAIRKIRANVAALLRDQRVLKPPVPIEKIARSLGLEVRYEPLQGDLYGALVRSDQENYIGVNSLNHPNRRRFTIAHELGHFRLHKGIRVHIDKGLRVNWRDEESSQAVSDEEMEANRFAAELLMPLHFLSKDIEKLKSVDQETVALLATRYRVSTQAMRIRLGNFGYILPD